MTRITPYLFTLLSLLIFVQEIQASQKLVLGVYQYQSKASVKEQYQDFANYLSNALPNYEVELKVYNQTELLNALKNKQLQMLLVNPNLYEVLRTKIDLNGVTATQQVLYDGQALDQLGGVIFTKSSNPKIHQLSDLIHQRIAIPSKTNTGAYRVPLYEIYKAGIDYKKLNFLEVGNNDSVIDAVLSGKADVGFVRTGIIEKWIASNRLKRDDIRVINQQHQKSFPQLLSTKLFPEWPFIILPGLDENLNRDIAVALYALRANHPVAKQAGIAGFVAPRDYLPFQNLLRTLKLPPFDKQPEITLLELWDQYKSEITLFVLLLLSIIALLFLSEKRKYVIALQEKRLQKKTKIDEVLLELPKYAETHTENELLQYALDKVEKLSSSSISFIHALDPKNKNIQFLAWSHNTLKNYCHIENYEDHYPVSKAGIWAEAVRQKQPVLINDYHSYVGEKSLPNGHVVLHRMISVPVIEHDQVVLIAGLGNKDTDYTQEDINVFQLVLNEIWRILKANRANQRTLQQKEKFQHLLDDLGENYVVFSHNGVEGVLSYVSAGFTQVFELPIETVYNRPWFSQIDWLPESVNTAKKSVKSLVLGEKTSETLILRFTSPQSKKIKTILVQHHGVYQNNILVSIDGLVTDITEKVEAEVRLEQAATVFESANEGILICDKNNLIVRANKRIEDITGYSEKELLGKNPKIFSSGHQDQAFYENLWHMLIKKGFWEGELWNRRKNGELYPERLKISTVLNNDNQPAYFIGLLSDITFEKEHQNELEKRAHFDALTNLPNRFLLSDRISQAIHAIQRTDLMISIMFIDLDRFKLVNDTYGHQAGDFLLKTLANRLLDCIRESDSVARIGGDEFVVVVSGTKDQHEFTKIEQRILKETSTEVLFEEHTLQVSSSIGVVYYGHNYNQNQGSEQLLRLADQAMYLAKQHGKNKIQHYQWDNLQNKNQLTHAFEHNLFELYYQPKVNCKTGQVLSLEGLIRLNHPTKGVLSPIEFLTDIEQFGFMDQLSDFVIQEGLQYLERLNQNQQNKIGISLNIQGNSLLHDEFIDNLVTSVSKNKYISPEQITLEILESSSLDEVERIAQQISLLKTKGFKFSIDDFGTGHASLTYLNNLPVNEVKIDQEFIREIFSNPNSLSIIEAIKSMAEAFNLSVIAEGAETNEHIELLLQLGIELVQGYAIAKPMSQHEMNKWLNSWQANQYWQTLIEIKPKNKQILKARLAHLAWLNKLETAIGEGELDYYLFQTSPNTCEFGLWLQSKGKEILNSTEFQTVDRLHQEIHQLAKQTIDLSLLGNEKGSSQQLIKLKQKSTQLNNLLHDIQA
ncbi:EAL domain-containing protein [Thiomicrorhabdus sp.]|uniref:EAL domain-containing protein n=1 Tax=Thiomicrorhabdus sp. TaxID=2039724 RepID=UPI002AA72BDA|nr:EAL domain-containing protein [Thiomicrorhabdus sp.]